MKKITFYCIYFLFFSAILMPIQLAAQKNKSLPDTTHNWSVYRNGLLFNDLDVAKNALFDLLVQQPENKGIYDSLAHLYFRMGAYAQAIQAGEKANPTGAIKEITAYSLRNLGDIKTALPIFEELYKTTDTPENGYQVATMQYALKRYGECMETIEKLKVNPDCKTLKVVISTEQGDNNQVSYAAAIENLTGVLYLEMGKPEMAKSAFEKAIAEEPDFNLAKKNLENVSKSAPVK